MIRIIALNEEEKDDDSDEEIVTTKEAQETIVEYEYVRAMKLRFENKPKLALSLLVQLLDTDVLNIIALDKGNEKLCSIRYNCHKNIAIISEEMKNYGIALDNYVMAMQLDPTDVHTMSRFGNFVLQRNSFELAQYAFENCLNQNPKHWIAADGILQTLCRTNNILATFHMALTLYHNDSVNKTTCKTLKSIYKTFQTRIPFFEKICGYFPKALTKEIDDDVDNVFFQQSDDSKCVETNNLNIKQFSVNKLTFLSLGQFIVDVYIYLRDRRESAFYTLTINDIWNNSKLVQDSNEKTLCTHLNSMNNEITTNIHTNTIETNLTPLYGENTLNVNQNLIEIIPVDKSKEDNLESLINNSNGDSDTVKSKPRRRCSDLHFLEQWGWHKNRSSRKKIQQGRVENDTSLKGFLQRMFSKFTNITFNDEWPFDMNAIKTAEISGEDQCSSCKSEVAITTFEQLTQNHIDDLVQELQNKQFDLALLVYKWLKAVSKFWNICLPTQIVNVYLKIYSFYYELFSFNSWNLLTNDNLEASYRICVLYLELEYSQTAKEKCEIATEWEPTFNHLLFTLSRASFTIKNFTAYQLRVFYLKYLFSIMYNQLEESVLTLKDIECILNKNSKDYILHIPNLIEDCLRETTITDIRKNFERELELNKITELFENENWLPLIRIIQENILYTNEINNCENWLKDLKVQLEILIQALWKTNSYEDCLIWCEKYIHYSIYNFLKELRGSYRRIIWEECINFSLSYIEAIIICEGFEILINLDNHLPRLVQNIIRLLSYYLDAHVERNANIPTVNLKRLWLILYHILLKEENPSAWLCKAERGDSDDEEEIIPNSFLLLFTAHEFLGKHQWCTKDNGEFLSYILEGIAPNLRAPVYDSCRDIIYEYIEQLTFCLYGYPQKKAKSRHLEDHEATQVELTWQRAVQIFDLYRPDSLPEFNSYKLESISSDMEQLLLKILILMPNELDLNTTAHILKYINGETNIVEDSSSFILPFKINSIFYLLADYYFKNRDFLKTIRYYTLDLASNPTRFDSWAGLALSKASNVETKINTLVNTSITDLLSECDEAIRCFEKCITLNNSQTTLWIEYGSFTYIIHSYCSRYLKQSSENLSMEEFSFVENRKDNMLMIAYNCFTMAETFQNSNMDTNDECNEEQWLSQYMLGKIAEKRKENPQVYINYYIQAANHLYESKATYPIKINHNNPTTLSVEALEVFYRTNSAIIKYIEHESIIKREIGDFFKKVLENLSKSPFAFNKAKIDGNSLNVLKRKITLKPDECPLNKVSKESKDQSVVNMVRDSECKKYDAAENMSHKEHNEYQENTAVGSRATLSNCSSSSFTSEESNDFNETDKNIPYTKAETANLYKYIIENFEECITRFPEHYKSIYRLVFHFLNHESSHSDINKCVQLLLEQYKTNLDNQINGLFYDRKTNNLFNGIWRIPSSEVDRPGSFSSHLSKCIGILIQVLMKLDNYKLLIDVGLQLYKTPDNDKRYIKDDERIELYKQCITYCAQILRKTFKCIADNRDDGKLIELLIDIYKIYKKCVKHLNQKEQQLTQVLIDVYKFYLQDKVEYLPENLNFLDLAIKMCVQQLATSRNIEKQSINHPVRSNVHNTTEANNATQISTQMISPSLPIITPMQSLLKCKFKSSNINTKPVQNSMNFNVGKLFPSDNNLSTHAIPQYIDFSNFPLSSPNQVSSIEFQRLYTEYYKKLLQLEHQELNSNNATMTSSPYLMNSQTINDTTKNIAINILPKESNVGMNLSISACNSKIWNQSISKERKTGTENLVKEKNVTSLRNETNCLPNSQNDNKYSKFINQSTEDASIYSKDLNEKELFPTLQGQAVNSKSQIYNQYNEFIRNNCLLQSQKQVCSSALDTEFISQSMQASSAESIFKMKKQSTSTISNELVHKKQIELPIIRNKMESLESKNIHKEPSDKDVIILE